MQQLPISNEILHYYLNGHKHYLSSVKAVHQIFINKEGTRKNERSGLNIGADTGMGVWGYAS